jgi:hypothetical protein
MPTVVRTAVTAQIGAITSISPVSAGTIAEFASVLETAQGTFFCKGAQINTLGEGHLRNEIRFNPALSPNLVPRLRWQIETEGWLVAGFDRVAGRHVNLAPGSADLPVLAATLGRMAAELTPCPVAAVQPASDRWGRLLDPALVDGNTLNHADMTQYNFLVDRGRVSVVDWSMPCRGAAWLDTARMVVRLIRAGHTPDQAEAWAQTAPPWQTAPPAAVDAFAAAVATMSRRKAAASDAKPHLAKLATASTAWAQHRTS